jgi:hypothetical protein
MMATAPITIPEIMLTFAAKNIAASEVAVFFDLIVYGQRKTITPVNATP